MIATDVDASQAPVLFSRFESLIGARTWLAPTNKLLAHTRRNELLRDYYLTTHSIAFMLAQCSDIVARYGALPVATVGGLEPCVAFMAQVISVFERMPPKARSAYVARVKNALSRASEMRGLQLEMAVATHFGRRGNSVIWPELDPQHPAVDGATFDLLIQDVGPSGLEVECKAVSHDKGRVLRHEAVLEFSGILRAQLKQLSANMRGGLAVIVTVPDQLPAAHGDRKALAKGIHEAILGNHAGPTVCNADVRLVPFDMSCLRGTNMVANNDAARMVVDSVTGTRNRNVVAMGRPNAGAILVALQSAKDDTLRDAIEMTARKASQQLSRRRPGIVVMGLDGIEARQLVDIAMQDQAGGQHPTLLALAASSILGGSARQHLVGVGFLSKSDRPTIVRGGSTETGGSVYHFPNSGSPHWHQDFDGLFRPRQPRDPGGVAEPSV